ncbi:MAG: SAM-dependent methyltransferase [Bryobacteraceae bacterium]
MERAVTAGDVLRAEIGARGPLKFSRFMEIALYHPQCGYYRRGEKIFGREGDFYTAAQMQPVFGRLLGRALEQLHAPAQADGRVLVADWGAGQSDLRQSLSGFDYRAVELAHDEAPERFEGIVLANELFDALPVEVAVREAGMWRERRVTCEDGRFKWAPGPELAPEWREYAVNAAAEARWNEDPVTIELPIALRPCVEQIDRRIARGWIIALDYGYTQRELIRFPNGTLMAYRRHRAFEEVLEAPGENDVTAHVPFDELRRCARNAGWEEAGVETMGQFLMRAGERDKFASALEANQDGVAKRLRLQLKSLLFDLGETFRVLAWKKA